MNTVFVRAKPISRGNGQSSVACSAYRSCSNLLDEREEKTHFYSRKSGLIACGIQAPNDEEVERQRLWNLVEQSENRKDARTAKEYIIAIPYYLPDQDKIETIKKIAKHLSKDGRVVDWAIHSPNKKGDNRNFHCHMMMTERSWANGELSKKKNREWNTKEYLANHKKEIADIFNERLRELGLSEIDKRTYLEKLEDGEVVEKPQRHKGPAITNIERKLNRQIKELEKRELELEKILKELEKNKNKNIFDKIKLEFQKAIKENSDQNILQVLSNIISRKTKKEREEFNVIIFSKGIKNAEMAKKLFESWAKGEDQEIKKQKDDPYRGR